MSAKQVLFTNSRYLKKTIQNNENVQDIHMEFNNDSDDALFNLFKKVQSDSTDLTTITGTVGTLVSDVAGLLQSISILIQNMFNLGFRFVINADETFTVPEYNEFICREITIDGELVIDGKIYFID